MIVVTGAAGFIGSNILLGLNAEGYTDIIAVDDLSNGHQYANLAAAKIADYVGHQDFLAAVESRVDWLDEIEVIFHQGACSKTTEWDGRYMLENNYDYSKTLLHFALEKKIPFIYASSAAVYGVNQDFDDSSLNQMPLNVYGYSKWLFDQYVLRQLPMAESPVVGLRYFNVYGPHEQFKGGMASVAWHLMQQLQCDNEVRLFVGSHGYADGEQLRDFIFVDDVVNVNLWCWRKSNLRGVYNCGTGEARSFNAIANQLITLNGSGCIQYIPFPDSLAEAYQAFTQANISKLRLAGYEKSFNTLEQGLEKYYAWFKAQYKVNQLSAVAEEV
jgi:ADP-L-glycero-D-manno-heptose 6-epimerase